MPINQRNLCIYDLETGGLDYRIHPVLQIGAIIIDPRSLEVIPGAEFKSYIKPAKDAVISEEALRVTGLNLSDLEDAPNEKVVWKDFVNFVNKYNKGKTKFTAPIPCGYNIINFDMKFINVLCQKYGQWDEARDEQTLFGWPYIDVMHNMWSWFESNGELKSLSMDELRKYFGVEEKGHDALVDCRTTHKILRRFLWFQRKMAAKTEFKGCFAEENSSANVTQTVS